MAIETSLQPRQKWWNILYAFICGALGLWGAYDYWVTIPEREAAVAAYDAAAKTFDEMDAKTRTTAAAPGGAKPLTAEDVLAYEAAKKVVEKGKPTAPAAYDRPVQLWMYIVGCGVLGVPWFLWEWLGAARRRYRMDDEGNLITESETVRPSDIRDIDMTKWMSKSTATVITTDGRKIVLDDYKYRGLEKIVGAIAVRFYPESWTIDGRDLNKIRTEEAEAAVRSGSIDISPDKNA